MEYEKTNIYIIYESLLAQDYASVHKGRSA